MNRPSPDDMKAMGVMEYVQELEKENKNLKAKVDVLQLKLDQSKRDKKELEKEVEELKEDNRVKKINEYDEEYAKANTLKECIKDNTLKRDFSRQRIRELEEDIHMLRVENDILRKKIRGEY